MPTLDGNMMRYDAADPEDLKFLVANGAIWHAGPKAQQAAIEALVDGTLPMNDRVPAEVVRYVESQKTGGPAPAVPMAGSVMSTPIGATGPIEATTQGAIPTGGNA